jgi:hypothetical protein
VQRVFGIDGTDVRYSRGGPLRQAVLDPVGNHCRFIAAAADNAEVLSLST